MTATLLAEGTPTYSGVQSLCLDDAVQESVLPAQHPTGVKVATLEPEVFDAVYEKDIGDQLTLLPLTLSTHNFSPFVIALSSCTGFCAMH